MEPQFIFVGVMLLLAVSAYGWGALIVRLLSSSSRLSSNRIRVDPALDIAIGIAAFLAVGGYFVAANLARLWFLIGWQGVGVVLTIVEIVRERSFRTWGSLFRFRLVIGWLGVITLCFAAIGPAMSGAWNVNDDAPAYSYLGQRLLATGGLIDPFNTRRLNSYGGAELFQAIVIRTVNVAAGIGVEWFFFLLLTVALFIRSIRRPWAPWMIWTVGILTVVMRPVGGWANMAPALSGAALTLALARIISEHGDSENPRWAYLTSGLLFAALFALRLEFIVAGAAIVVIFALTRTRRRFAEALVLTAIASLISLLGWSIALKRSSGSWVFPLDSSYWTQQTWYLNPAIHTLSQHLRELISILGFDDIGIGLMGSVAIAGLAIVLARARGMAFSSQLKETSLMSKVLVTLALVFGTLVLAVSQAWINSGSTLYDITRYVGPSALATVLFSVSTIWDCATSEPESPGVRTAATRQRLMLIAPVALSIGLFAWYSGQLPRTLGSSMDLVYRQSYRAVSGQPVLSNNWSSDFRRSQLTSYEQISRKIPAGSHVLAAVTLPGDLDFSRFDFTTLDEPGGTSPPPHLPLGESDARIIAYLHGQGIDGIVGTIDSAYGLYNISSAEQQLDSTIPNYRMGSRYIVLWDQFFLRMRHRFRTARAHNLRYVDLDSPIHTAKPAKR